MNNKILLITILTVLVMFGCSQSPGETAAVTSQPTEIEATTQVQAIQTKTPYIFKTSNPGFFTIKGRLTVMDPMLMFPDLDDGIFLVPMDNQVESLTTVPQFVKGNVPQAEVDETTGDFVFTDINPGQYAVVVLTMNGQQVPARILESESLAILTLEEGDETIIDLNYLMLP